MTKKPKFEDLFVTCRLPEDFAERFQKEFEGIPLEGSTIFGRWRDAPISRFLVSGNERHPQCVYRELGRYAEETIESLLDKHQRTALNEQFAALASTATHGIFFQGLPRDPALKGAFLMGLERSAGANELFPKLDKMPSRDEYHVKDTTIRDYRYCRLPGVLQSEAEDIYGFHFDNVNAPILRESHFMALGSAQDVPYYTPTLFKRKDWPDKKHVAMAFKPDEMVLSNDSTLKHSPDRKHLLGRILGRYKPRLLIRDQFDSDFAHSREHGAHVAQLNREFGVPESREERKEWLIRQLSDMGKETYATLGR